ncbi:hypothetical protein NST55_28920 [Bacillus sp. FSL R10-2789]|uniref:hypothetical protein n=1 Tax=Bacillus sp. FSL R10-2789 TaxID=2954662 RepID=UPI0030F5CE9C
MLEITKVQLEDLCCEDSLQVGETELTVVESSGWEQDHKSQSKSVIFTDGEKFYRGHVSRSGSPFTSWTWDSEVYGANDPADIEEVTKVTVREEVWSSSSQQVSDPVQERLREAESLLADARNLLDNIHGYEYDTYRDIGRFLYGEEEEE